MDELTLDGKVYLSSKRAAAVTGYAKDYVGQLCREGRVEARLVGRSWYVYEPSIMKHRFNEEGGQGDHEEVEEQVETLEKEETIEEIPSEKTNVQAVFGDTTYSSEPAASLPVERSREDVSEIEDAWKEWFAEDKEAVVQEETVETPVLMKEEHETEEVVHEEEAVPLHIVRKVPIPAYERPVYKATEPTRSYKPGGKKPIQANVILKAVLVAAMLISITIASLGAGLGGSFSGLFKGENAFIRAIEGITEVK